MKTFVIFAILLASSLTISESYAYLETAIDVCETLYNRPNVPSPSYDPEKYQECVEQAESLRQNVKDRWSSKLGLETNCSTDIIQFHLSQS